MFSIATAPAKQSVGETISVLSGRLSSASLLEDRRAAILGLRSFAKEYPASVASGALRSLIGSLAKDGEDVDTVKVVLETLLMLFSPNQDSPEASEEIALWLADEFTQRQENITLLLDFLETPDFYSRLYSLQLLTSILSARTERTEECIFTAPLGIPRLVAVLDDSREAIRNEALTLLIYLTPSSTEIQKLVAFENAFDRVFRIIAAEGSILEGDRVVEDCLIFLVNLLRLNASNQSLFRETGFIPQLSRLLQSTYTAEEEDGQEIAPWAQAQRNRNTYALLAVIRLFLVDGAVGTVQNQNAFWQHSILYHALQLSFSHTAEVPIKGEALVTCADIIRGNSKLQENFAQLQVPALLGDVVNGNASPKNGVPKVFVIDGLLDLALTLRDAQAFDIRRAACECLKAYFHDHPEIRLHFLRRAIEGHNSGADETANVLTTLLRPVPEISAVDPYRSWFAAVIMLHLVYENPTAKAMAMAVTEGDEEDGEEVVTSIQTITAHLISSLSRGDDSRVAIGYLMLLLCWLFEDLDGVNDFLGEGSNVQGLIQAALRTTSNEAAIVQGLCAMLLGVVYEFSTKDSAIPRTALQPILMSRLGRDKYVDRLTKLRSHPFVRDFEVLPQKLDPSSGQKLPDVFFDTTFVNFFKDNYSRILRGIDREPGMEISVVTNGVQKGISRELVDSLRSQLEEKEHNLQDAQVKIASLGQQLGQAQADLRRIKETSTVDLARIKSINEALQRSHEEEINKLRTEHRLREEQLQRQADGARKAAEAELERLQKRNEADLRGKEDEFRRQTEEARKRAEAELRAKEDELRRQAEEARKRAQSESDRFQRRAEAEMADLKATISSLEVDLIKANKSKAVELQAAEEKHDAQLAEQTAALKKAQDRVAELEKKSKGKAGEFEKKSKEAEARATKAEASLKRAQEEKRGVQSELDDLLMVFGDLEEKVAKYKARLEALGETISDDENDEDDDDDEEDDDDDDDDDDDKAHSADEDVD